MAAVFRAGFKFYRLVVCYLYVGSSNHYNHNYSIIRHHAARRANRVECHVIIRMEILQKNSFTFADLFRRKWIGSFITGLAFMSISFVVSHYAFVYAHAYSMRATSTYVGDILLDNLPVVNLNFIIVEGALFAIAAAIIFVLLQPRYILFTIKMVALFIITRALFMSLTHVGIYPGHIDPGLGLFDNIYLYFNFQTGLFFSGHTCAPILFALLFWEQKMVRYSCLAIAVIFGVSVLFAHVHYSIDVFAAPFMAYGIFNMAKYFFSHEYELIKPRLS